MQNTMTINTDLLGLDFIQAIKKSFPHKIVEIAIQSADETENILSNDAYATELRNRISEFNTKKEVVILKSDELI